MNKQKQTPQNGLKSIVLIFCLGVMSYLPVGLYSGPGRASAAIDVVVRRINIPYLGAGPPLPGEEPPHFFEPAIFWFGQVTPTVNNADVRLWYYDEYMKVTVHIIDRQLWYDQNRISALEEWDAASLFLNKDGNRGSVPTSNAYRLVAQVNYGWEPDDDFKVAYRGNGSTWAEDPLSFTADTAWRGGGLNNDNTSAGWQVTYVIPFSSLGLTERPAEGMKWGLAVAIHDRDDAGGNPAIADQVWPEMADTDAPATWGEMNFGIPAYNRPMGVQQGITTIRNELNGAEVIDGHVGGHGNCGAGLNKWTEWGEKNYKNWESVNIQNQWDISDFPCFSKYFVTFPLEQVPPGKSILAASLSMTRFGNAGGGDWGVPEDSYIQVLIVAEDWDEQILNWNNAPRAVENISGTWVEPVQTSEQKVYDWDVSRAVGSAYQAGEPLRLAMYSADGERHSGKYFWSSNSNYQKSRPTLQVIWGVPCDAPGVECHFAYLPAIPQ